MKTCKYKGREYEVKYLGTTKFGEKAKLAFIGGSEPKEFWAPAEALTDIREDDRPSSPKGSAPAPKKAPALTVGEPCPTCGRTVLGESYVSDADDDSIPF